MTPRTEAFCAEGGWRREALQAEDTTYLVEGKNSSISHGGRGETPADGGGHQGKVSGQVGCVGGLPGAESIQRGLANAESCVYVSVLGRALDFSMENGFPPGLFISYSFPVEKCYNKVEWFRDQ